jgi:hypothetical protein
MFRFVSLCLVGLAAVLSLGKSTIAQETSLSTALQAPLPLPSNERLGTGVPSRLPKVEVQRPVFTIQSGGPVALPVSPARPSREAAPAATPAKEAKSALPIIEQTRPWQKPGLDERPANERFLPNRAVMTPPLPASGQTTQRTPTPVPSQLINETPSAVRPFPTGPVVAVPTPASRSSAPSMSPTPARVLNFSINDAR